MKWSVVNRNELDHLVQRLDAEFYHPDFVSISSKISKYTTSSIEEIGGVLDCSAFYPSITDYYNFEAKGIPFLRVNEIQNGFVKITNSTAFLPEEIANEYKGNLAQSHPGDIIIAKGGNTLGKVGLLTNEYPKYAVSRDLIILKTSQLKNIRKVYLWIYLHSEYGQKLILRTASQTGQPHLTLPAIKAISTPLLSNQPLFDQIYETSVSYLKRSEKLYAEAQTLLLKELDLLNWQPKHKLSYVKTFSDTQTAERFDAEYFQPKYEEVDAKILSMRPSVLGDLCSHLNYGTVPTSPYAEKGVPYIKGLNLVNGFVKGKLDLLENTKNLPSKFFTKENDIIISQMGTVGKAGIVTKNQEDFLFASFTIRARLNNFEFIDPYVLTLYINEVSRPYYLLRKIAQASVRQNTDLPTLKALPVPTISNQMQESIKQGIIESYELKQKSKSLLEIAKTGVEKAIETTEEEAMQWMTAEIDKLDVSLELTN